MKLVLAFLLLCGSTYATEFSTLQPLRAPYQYGHEQFGWRLNSTAIPIGWDNPSNPVPGYRLGDTLDVEVTTSPVRVTWVCQNCYLTYDVHNLPTLDVPIGLYTFTVTHVNDPLWGFNLEPIPSVGVHEVVLPEPSSLMLVIFPLLFLLSKRNR